MARHDVAPRHRRAGRRRRRAGWLELADDRLLAIHAMALRSTFYELLPPGDDFHGCWLDFDVARRLDEILTAMLASDAEILVRHFERHRYLARDRSLGSSLRRATVTRLRQHLGNNGLVSRRERA